MNLDPFKKWTKSVDFLFLGGVTMGPVNWLPQTKSWGRLWRGSMSVGHVRPGSMS